MLKRATEDDAGGLVEREAAALVALAGHDVPAPALVAADATGSAAGGPCVLMTLLPGAPVLAPNQVEQYVRRLAEMQAHIHSVTTPFGFPMNDAFAYATDWGWIVDPGLRRDALDAVSPPEMDPVFAHGDYQPFNVLWRDRRISGVVDWTMAGTGPRGVDVGHCRLNLAVLSGPDAAECYLDAYESSAELRIDPGSDLRALLAWNPGWLEFVPRQVAGRVPLDLDGMADRVTETIRRALRRSG